MKKKRKYSKKGQKNHWPPIVEGRKKYVPPVGIKYKELSKDTITRLKMDDRFDNPVVKSRQICLDLMKEQNRGITQIKEKSKITKTAHFKYKK